MENIPDKKDLLTTSKVADILGISKITLRKHIREKKVPGATYRDGAGQKFWTEEDVDKVRIYRQSLRKGGE